MNTLTLTHIHTLTFTSNGHGHGLYTEVIDLGTIGRLSLERATSIEFQPTSQQWEVRLVGGDLLFTHSSRETCLAWEHRHFNQ